MTLYYRGLKQGEVEMDISSVNLDNLLNGVTAEAPRENKSFIPVGKYNVVIEKITGKENAAGWKGLNFQLRVFGNKCNNYVLFDLVSIVNPDPNKSVAKSLSKLQGIKDLTGVNDLTKMLGKKLHVAVGVVEDEYKVKNGEVGAEKNIIWGYGEVLDMNDAKLVNSNTVKTDANFTSDQIPF